ncbi:hypothetical protein CMO95_02085 [Candidatus Woesearchaeota archaeon]|nr:hypothetical protein [Candidatus Woesearchaeota archaeon]|tara:strand:+ start:3566 stop:4033 length:468 start_codon:yes stop_codon:yes gene_type:complete
MALINGTSFGLFHNGNILGHSTQTKFSLSVDLPESTTKESAGFQEVIAGVRSGTISVSALTNYSDNLNFEQLADMVLTRQENEFVFEQSAFEGLLLIGNAIIQNVEEIAETENVVSFDIELQLTGLFSIQQQGTDRYWNTTDVLWENANFEWQVA